MNFQSINDIENLKEMEFALNNETLLIKEKVKLVLEYNELIHKNCILQTIYSYSIFKKIKQINKLLDIQRQKINMLKKK
jgi:hypothetical protein